MLVMLSMPPTTTTSLAVEQQAGRAREIERLQTGAAGLVDRHRDRRVRHPGVERDLPGRVRPRAELAGLAEQHLVDVRGRDPGLCEGGLGGRDPEVDRGQRGERAAELADRRPLRAEDHDSFHRTGI